MRRAALLLCVPCLLILAACGGGGGGSGSGGDDGGGGDPGGGGDTGGDVVRPSGDSPPLDPSFVVGSSTAAVSLIGFEGDGTLRTGTPESVVNLATGAVTGGLFAGTLNVPRTRIDLAAGGTAELTNPGETEYVRLFRTAPVTGDPVFGVTGFPTAPADLPASGRVSYTGATQIEAADATRLYTLAGTAFVTADFGGRQVRIELRDLEGQAQGVSPGNTGPVAVPPGGRITVEGSAITGAAFTGGRASAAGLPFGITGAADASGTRGGFFGPGADEVGGRVVVSDPAGDVGILGTFAAD
jgi:hypothetical protein